MIGWRNVWSIRGGSKEDLERGCAKRPSSMQKDCQAINKSGRMLWVVVDGGS